jgi:hypothetical protein
MTNNYEFKNETFRPSTFYLQHSLTIIFSKSCFEFKKIINLRKRLRKL